MLAAAGCAHSSTSMGARGFLSWPCPLGAGTTTTEQCECPGRASRHDPERPTDNRVGRLALLRSVEVHDDMRVGVRTFVPTHAGQAVMSGARDQRPLASGPNAPAVDPAYP